MLTLGCLLLGLLPASAAAAGSARALTTTENDTTNSLLSTACSLTPANAIFTSGTFTLSGVVNDSGVVITSLFTGEASHGPSPNQVMGSATYLGAHANAFVNFTGQLKCDGPDAARITSVVSAMYIYDTVGSQTMVYSFDASSRSSSASLDFVNQTLSESFNGALQRIG